MIRFLRQMPLRAKRIVSLYAGALLLLLSLGLGSYQLYRAFESITFQTLSRLNRDFVSQIDALSGAIHSEIVNYGFQLFNSNAVQLLMSPRPVSNTQRVYAMRELTISLGSTVFADQAILYNPYTNRVYATDARRPDVPLDEFPDSSVKELILNSTHEDRFKPILIPDAAGNKNTYAFLFFDSLPKQIDGKLYRGVLLIKVPTDWYRRSFASLAASDTFLIRDKLGALLLQLGQPREALLQKYGRVIREAASGYIIDKQEKLIVLYYRSPQTGHTYLRVLPESEALPQLLYFRKALLSFGAVLLLLYLGSAGFVFLSYWRPMKRRLATAVSDTLSLSREQLFSRLLELGSAAESDCTELFAPHALWGMALCSGQLPAQSARLSTLPPDSVCVPYRGHTIILTPAETAGAWLTLLQQLHDSLQLSLCYAPLFSQPEDAPACAVQLLELSSLCRLLCLPEPMYSTQLLVGRAEHDEHIDALLPELRAQVRDGNNAGVIILWQSVCGRISELNYAGICLCVHRLYELVLRLHEENSGTRPLEPESLPEENPDFTLPRFSSRMAGELLYLCGVYRRNRELRQQEIAAEIHSFIEAHYLDPDFSAQSVTEHWNMSHSYLSRIFRSVFHCSISDAVNACRIEHSKRLLFAEDSMPIEQAALRSGFSNTKYFYVLFRKFTGQTPRQYRAASLSPVSADTDAALSAPSVSSAITETAGAAPGRCCPSTKKEAAASADEH